MTSTTSTMTSATMASATMTSATMTSAKAKAPSTILDSIEDKYSDDEEDYGFIVFVSNSPETKKGMFPTIMTLCDYNIERVGTSGFSLSKLSHISELDLTDNILAEWSEILILLKQFPGLQFLNLSNNLLADMRSEETSAELSSMAELRMRKFVLNGNRIGWATAGKLIQRMPSLEELYFCTNNLGNPQEPFQHANLRQLYLSCNPIDDFSLVLCHVGGSQCPRLQHLTLAECPVTQVPQMDLNPDARMSDLYFLNLSVTKISSWEDIDRLRRFPALTELRVQNCPLLEGYTKFERRSLLIARLPNVQILNGGDKIPPNEREDAERGFIRYYLSSVDKPGRYAELTAVHGQLDPLVVLDMAPSTHVRVNICYKDDVREEVISVYQTVQQFKVHLHATGIDIPPQNMRLYYCDQVMSQIAGPEEMKYPQKALYSYNVEAGDSFQVDEKLSLARLRVSRSASNATQFNSPSPKSHARRSITFTMVSPSAQQPAGGGSAPPHAAAAGKRNSSQMNARAAVARNLFGKSPVSKGN